MINFIPELVSDEELELLADSYTARIEDLKAALALIHNFPARKKTRLEMLNLMKRRYYLRICLNARRTQN
jgi:hypothetical protein